MLKEEGENYAYVMQELGCRTLKVFVFDENKVKRAIILKSNEKIFVKDIVLVQDRDYETRDDQVNVVHKYHDNEVKVLQQYQYIPQDIEQVILDYERQTAETMANVEEVLNTKEDDQKKTLEQKKKDIDDL